MDIGLGIAGVICIAMAFGHETIGSVWVLPSLSEEQLPRTPFGSSSMSLNMIRVTWHVVTIFVFAVGALLLNLAWDADADPGTLLLRWFAAMWLVATAMALWVVRANFRHPQRLLRLPVPVLWVVVAILCWRAAGS